MERTIKPEDFIANTNKESNEAMILDVRRDNDYEASEEIISKSNWQDPSKMDDWVGSIPKDKQVIIYCVFGGGVSNSVVDRLQAEGINAQFIEGGIEGLKKAGGTVVQK